MKYGLTEMCGLVKFGLKICSTNAAHWVVTESVDGITRAVRKSFAQYCLLSTLWNNLYRKTNQNLKSCYHVIDQHVLVKSIASRVLGKV